MDARRWDYQDGAHSMVGELYAPAGASKGSAVLVFHEADGVGPNVRRHCAMLAGLGYIAAAADMHGGGRTLAPDEIPLALERFQADAELVRGRGRAAFDALRVETGLSASRIVVIGYCFGGYVALELARSGLEAAGMASFHGLLTTSRPASPDSIRAPIFVATGVKDPLVPSADVAAFEEEMRLAKADWHLLKHGRALHSFTNASVDRRNDPRMRYDPLADTLSWAAFTGFLDAVVRK